MHSLQSAAHLELGPRARSCITSSSVTTRAAQPIVIRVSTLIFLSHSVALFQTAEFVDHRAHANEPPPLAWIALAIDIAAAPQQPTASALPLGLTVFGE